MRPTEPGLGRAKPADTAASLIQGSNQVAVAYPRGKLGNLKRANSAQEALRASEPLTLDGMGGAWRL